MIYLDNASTTYPKPPEVYDFVDKFNREQAFNANRGLNKKFLAVQNIIQETRKLMLDLTKSPCNKYETIFASSATIALNMVLQGINYKDVKNVYVTPFEHNSVLRVLYYL